VKQEDENHGYDGPLHVSYGGSDYELANDYIAAAKLCGYDDTLDVNDFTTVNKTAKWPKWIHPVTGKRSDAAHGFVHPIREHQDNLHLLVETKVSRIIFEDSVAVGVQCVAKYRHFLLPLNI